MSNKSTAYCLWCDGKTLEAGKLLFEEIPEDQRGLWATSVLELALEFAPVSNLQVRRLARMASRRCLWFTAHSHFDSIREQTLKLEKKIQRLDQLSRDDTIRLSLCFLAEGVAKVIYNSTNPIGPFDDDSGWHVTPAFHTLLTDCADDRFSKEAELLLFGRDAIELASNRRD